MANTLPPVRGVAFTFEIGLVSRTATSTFVATPTLAAGDIQVSKDGAQFVNIATFPPAVIDLASGADSGLLSIILTIAEMTADRVVVNFHDAAGAEWQDTAVTIFTSAQTLDATDVVADGIKTKTDFLPSVVAGGAGGVFIAGTNAATSVTTALTANITGNVSGSVGSVTGLTASNLDAPVSSRSTYAGGAVASVTGAVGSVTGLTTATIADAVWNEAIADHVTAGSTGRALSDAGAAGDPWAATTRTLTSTAAATTAAVSGSTLTITNAATYSATLTGMTIPADWLDMWFTVKDDDSKTDSAAIIQIHKSNPADATNDGLVYLNGAAGTKADGSLTVNQAAGTVAISIAATSTDDLARQSCIGYDLKVQSTAAGLTVLTEGTCNIQLTETRTID